MTDSIEAAAVRATGSTEQAAIRSIAAGDDIVLTTGQGSWIRVYRALLARGAGLEGRSAPRVRESAARVLALQRVAAVGHPSVPKSGLKRLIRAQMARAYTEPVVEGTCPPAASAA